MDLDAFVSDGCARVRQAATGDRRRRAGRWATFRWDSRCHPSTTPATCAACTPSPRTASTCTAATSRGSWRSHRSCWPRRWHRCVGSAGARVRL